MISPPELVKLIVANNPQGVRRNLLQNGLVGQNYQVSSEGFMQLLSELPEHLVGTREQAIGFVTKMLNVNIDPAGVGGTQLIQLGQSFNGSVSQLVAQVFEQNMPPSLVKQTSTCGCHNQSIDGQQITILTLAAIGLLFIITIFVKLFLKILQ